MTRPSPRELDRLPVLPRAQLASAIAAWIPDSMDPPPDRAAINTQPEGGRRAALRTLSALDPACYARTRNHVDGAVSGLSPWIRHGVLSLAEVRDHALARVSAPAEAEKFISELAWRDYWRRVHAAVGDRIAADIEPAAAPPRRPGGLDAVPADVLAAATGMRCIDAFVRKLHDTGRLHNHERMWLASWLVHVRRVRWQAGADWFLRHLLDGDPASNHLSWQWVAGTFAAKPYIFNRENLQTYTSDAHCAPCPLLGRCDVEGSYDDLAARLFAAGPDFVRPPLRIRPAPSWRALPSATIVRPLVWLTLDSASPTSPAVVAHPGAPILFVLDPAWLAAERPTLKRLVFLFECLRDVPGVMIEIGDPGAVVPAFARDRGCDGVALAATPCPRVRRGAEAVGRGLPVSIHDWPPLCADSRVDDLGRFSRFWSRVRATAMQPTGAAAA